MMIINSKNGKKMIEASALACLIPARALLVSELLGLSVILSRN